MTTTDDFVDTMVMPRRQTMPFEPSSYRKRRDGLAACRANACKSGDLPCPSPEACRLADEDAEDSEFGALEGLAMIFQELDEPEKALEVWKAVLAIHPHAAGVSDAINEIETDLEGHEL